MTVTRRDNESAAIECRDGEKETATDSYPLWTLTPYMNSYGLILLETVHLLRVNEFRRHVPPVKGIKSGSSIL